MIRDDTQRRSDSLHGVPAVEIRDRCRVLLLVPLWS